MTVTILVKSEFSNAGSNKNLSDIQNGLIQRDIKISIAFPTENVSTMSPTEYHEVDSIVSNTRLFSKYI